MTTSREFAHQIVARLRSAGYQAFWAGGCVRDQLLGIEPKDYDVATDARPEDIRRLFGRRRTLMVGAAFGVVAVLGPRSVRQIEVATFRQDDTYSDGRHPDRVRFSSPQEDALRRDFTINGLFLDPTTGQVIDYVGGQADLQAGIVRCIGDPHQRIAEDKLRMLRAIRFAATFRFQIHAASWQAVQQHAAEIQIVSPERIAAEMRRMLTHPQRALAMQLLIDSGLAAPVLPEVTEAIDAGGPQLDRSEMLRPLEELQTDQFAVALAALLWNVAQVKAVDPPSLVRPLAERWKLSNAERDETVWLLEHVPVVRQALTLAWPRLQPVLIHPHADHLLQLADALGTGEPAWRQAIAFSRQKRQLPRPVLDPPPLLDGNDLLQAGIPRGPQYRHLLQTARDAQLLGKVATKSAAMQLVQQAWVEWQEQEQARSR